MSKPRVFLFLQGPSSPFFQQVADGLSELGHAVLCIRLCPGDHLFWRRGGTVSFRGRLKAWPEFVEQFYDRHGVTDLVLLGEQREHHRLAIDLAWQREIRVTVTDFGYLRPDWINLERDGMSGQSCFPREPRAIRELAGRCRRRDTKLRFHDSFWTMARNEMAYHMGSTLFWWLYPHYRSFKLENPFLAYAGIGLRMLAARLNRARTQRTMAALARTGAAYYLYPLQLANDFQLRVYCDFPSQEAAIQLVIASFARHAPEDAHLLVKIHPWDPGLVSWRRVVQRYAKEAGVAGRAHFIDGGDIGPLCKAARGVVTINSTAGLLALRYRRPVMTLGQAIYDVPGLTYQAHLDTFWRQGTPPDADLLEDFLNAMAATIQVRGVFYAQPGLAAAVDETVYRLHHGLVGEVIEKSEPMP
jgi:capsular polysaccharide export protein